MSEWFCNVAAALFLIASVPAAIDLGPVAATHFLIVSLMFYGVGKIERD